MNSETVIILSFLNIFLAILIFAYNYTRNRNIIFLSIYLIIFSVYIMLAFLLIKGGPLKLYALLLNNFSPLLYLFPVMFYFYIRNTLTDSIRFRPYDFIHFIPFTINLAAVLPYMFTSWVYKLDIAQRLMCNLKEYLNYDFKLFYPHIINLIARPVQLGIYFVATVLLFVRFFPKYKTSTGNQRLHFNVVIYLLAVIFVTFMFLSVSQMVDIIRLLNSTDYVTFLHKLQIKLGIMGVFYLLIPLLVLFNPKFSYGMPQIKKSDAIIPLNETSVVHDKTQEKTKKTATKIDDNDVFMKLSSDILNYIHTEKPYLNPEFTVNDICIKLNVPQHHVEYCFNVIIEKKFTNLKNELRVERAKELLANEMAEILNMDGIGKNAGFASTSNFFFTFKKITGISPKQWLKNKKNF